MKDMGKNIKRVGAVLLSCAVLFAGAENYTLTAMAESDYEEAEEDALTKIIGNQTDSGDPSVDREETVYVITDAKGDVEQTIVSEWLKNPEGKDVLTDASSLENIENVKGDETYSAGSNDTIEWNANGNDIYYQGKTNEQTPIDVKITYYLDGEEIAPEDLAGKSGKVKIRFDYTNNELRTEEISGNEEDLCVPFTVVSALFLPVDSFSNVSVTNGKVVSDGSRNIVVGLAMPGLKESLDPDGKAKEELDERFEDNDITIPDYVEVEADATDFALDMTVSVAMPDLISDFDMAGGIDLSGLDESMDRLNDAAAALTNGTGELKSGADKLANGSFSLKDGAERLASGIGQYTAGVGQLTGGLSQLKGGSSQLAGGAGELAKGSGDLANGAAQVSAGVGKMSDSLNNMKTSLDAGIAEQQANKNALAPQVDADKAAVTSAVTGFGTEIANASATAAAGAAAQAAGNAAAGAAAQASASAAAGAAAKAAGDAVTTEAITAAMQEYNAGIGNVLATAQDPEAAQAAIKDLAGKMQNAAAKAAAGAVSEDLIAGAVASQTDSITAAAAGAASNSVQAAMADPNTQAAIAQAAGAAAQGVSSEGVTSAVTRLATDAGNLGGAVGAETALTTIQSQTDLSQLTDLVNGAQALASGAQDLANGAGQLANGANTLDQGMASALNGATALDQASGQLKSGSSELAKGAGTLADGMGKLDDGAGRLSEGIAQFDEEGIKKITNAVDGDVATEIDRIQKIMSLSQDYKTFTKLAEGETGKVKFIYRTGAIK
ncbi:MAG TPA: hypothetical protein DCG85_08195 [Lachnospiraceae bacterium]|nr:hypothetical protein [Lachnospiraceae bacterium]